MVEWRPVWVWLLVAVAAVWAAGCGQTESNVKQAGPEGTHRGQDQFVEFFDANSFDRDLSRALYGDPRTVTMTFPAPVTVNDIPERMDKWFAAIEDAEGEVTITATGETQSRGIITEVLSLIFFSAARAKEHKLIEPVEEYNAEIFYQRDNGQIERVVFHRRPAAELEDLSDKKAEQRPDQSEVD
jgi:hypothetical protein